MQAAALLLLYAEKQPNGILLILHFTMTAVVSFCHIFQVSGMRISSLARGW